MKVPVLYLHLDRKIRKIQILCGPGVACLSSLQEGKGSDSVTLKLSDDMLVILSVKPLNKKNQIYIF